MSEFNLTVDGTKYPVTWTRPTPPTDQDFITIAEGIRKAKAEDEAKKKVNATVERMKALSTSWFKGSKKPVKQGVSPAAFGLSQVLPAVAMAKTKPKSKVQKQLDFIAEMDDKPEDPQTAALISKTPNVKGYAASTLDAQERDVWDKLMRPLREFNRGATAAATTIAGSPVGSPIIPSIIRNPVVSTVASTLNPASYAQMVDEIASDPQGAAQGFIDSFTDIWQADSTPEQRVQSLINWGLTVAPFVPKVKAFLGPQLFKAKAILKGAGTPEAMSLLAKLEKEVPLGKEAKGKTLQVEFDTGVSPKVTEKPAVQPA